MFKVFFINFGYYSANESDTLEGAKKIARKAGFQSRIEHNGTIVATFCPMNGIYVYPPESANDVNLQVGKE